MTTLLGIDLGTSSVKVALLDAQTLRVRSSASEEYAVLHPQPGYAQQHPADWWAALVLALRATMHGQDSAQLAGIGLSGQMHGTVLLGTNQQVLHPAIIWADSRSTNEVAELADFTTEATMPGVPAAGFMAATLRWLHKHQPKLLDQTRHILLPKDYIRLRLTGSLGSEFSDASATWLFDVAKNAWARDVARYCGISLDQLPPLMPSQQVVGKLTAEAARELNLPRIPVVAGSADLPAQALGMGINLGQTLATVGTGGQIMTPLPAPAVDPAGRYYVFQHNLPRTWYAQAAILSGGLALRWLRDVIQWRDVPNAFEKLSALAAEVPAGADGLLFLPYLAGERSPHMDADASGLFFGLRLHHGLPHLARAVMEGVGFALKDCLTLVPGESETIILSGGAAESPVWGQILANIWRRPLRIATSSAPHGSIGAAMLAGIGTGIYPNAADAMRRLPEAAQIIQPETSSLYESRYAQFRRLYPLLRDEMRSIRD